MFLLKFLMKYNRVNSVVIGKCKINTGAIRALSFVKEDLKSWTVYADNPVKMIKKE